MSGANTFKFLMLPPQSDITRGWGRQLAEAMPEVRVVIAEDQATAEREIVDAEAAFGRLPRELLAKARRLRWLQAPQAAPPAGYYYPELIAHPLAVTNFREIFNDHIGAHIMAFVLAFARGLHVYIPQQLRREWKKPRRGSRRRAPAGGHRADRRRGRHRRRDRAARRGVRHDGAGDRRAPHASAPPGVAELHRPEALDTLLPRADFVILTVPHTPATEGFMHRARFQRMKRSAFFINIGRGMTTRLDDLVAALHAGEIAGAALDVFEQEPLPADHPLWTMPNVLITPHIAGLRPLPRRPALSDHARQLPRVPRRPAAAQRRRQGPLVLKEARHEHAGGGRMIRRPMADVS